MLDEDVQNSGGTPTSRVIRVASHPRILISQLKMLAVFSVHDCVTRVEGVVALGLCVSDEGDIVAVAIEDDAVTARSAPIVEIGSAVVAVVEDRILKVRAIAAVIRHVSNASVAIVILVRISCFGSTPRRRELVRLVSPEAFVESSLCWRVTVSIQVSCQHPAKLAWSDQLTSISFR